MNNKSLKKLSLLFDIYDGDKLIINWLFSYDGLRHRDNDKPALVCSDGMCVWYKHGEIHRTSGPAIIHANDDPFENFPIEEYWLDGEYYTKSQWEIIKNGREPLKFNLNLNKFKNLIEK